MDDASIFAVAALYMGLLALVALVVRRRRRARAAGGAVPTPTEAERRLTFGDVTVFVVYSARGEGVWTKLWATSPGFAKSLRLEPEGFSPRHHDLRVLDEAFDAIATVHGDPLDVVARVDPEARRLLADFLLRDDGRVADGAASRSFDARLDGAELERAAARLAAIATAIGRGETVDRLVDNLSSEASAAVRARNLALLLAFFPDDPRVQALAAPAPLVEAPWLALLKGSARGDAEALEAAARRLVGDAHLEPHDVVIGQATAERLARTGEAEWVLCAMLDEVALRAIAIRGLTETGTLEAVMPLTRFARRVSGEPALRTAALQAVARIQERAGGGAPGQLSLSTADAGGELELADD